MRTKREKERFRLPICLAPGSGPDGKYTFLPRPSLSAPRIAPRPRTAPAQPTPAAPVAAPAVNAPTAAIGLSGPAGHGGSSALIGAIGVGVLAIAVWWRGRQLLRVAVAAHASP